jgi:hypothetical protein
LASIDAFRELVESRQSPLPAGCLSLQRRQRYRLLCASDKHAREHRERRLILLTVAGLHVLMLLFLRVAMQPRPIGTLKDAKPMQIFIIERPKLAVAPPLPPTSPRVTIAPSVAPQPRTPLPRSVLRAVVVVPRPLPVAVEPPKGLLYSPDGELLVPPAPAPVAASPPDLLADRDVSHFLPGSAHQTRADFHVNADSKAKKALEKIGALFGGGRFDPCANIRPATVDIYDTKRWEEAQESHQRLCEGR